MEVMRKLVAVLPWLDWAALVTFVLGWAAYFRFARLHAQVRPSILATTNRFRRQWMLQSTRREVRVVDGIVIQNLSTSPSFFASTTILIIGGLLAILGTTEKTSMFVQEIPFAARTSALVFDLKVSLLLVIFVFSFFRFTWSLRQYSFGALLVGAAPEDKEYDAMEGGEAAREAFADKAGKVVALAAESFNDGLRGYYFAFAAVGWFFSPLVFVLATAGIIAILYHREFRSDVLAVLNA